MPGFTDGPTKEQKRKEIQKERLGKTAEAESEEESTLFEAYFTDSASERFRGEEGRVDVQDILNSESSDTKRKIWNPASKMMRNGKKALREIIRRDELDPLNYRALAEKVEAPLNLLRVFQASLDAAKKF